MPNPAWAWVKMYQEGNGRVPIGLLHRLTRLLDNNGYKYVNFAQRSNLGALYKKNDELYPFQQSALRMALLRRGGILQIPTGGGKTRIAISAIKTINLPTLVVVPTLDLVSQWKKQIPENAVVRTYQGIKSKSYLKQFGLVVFDECHRTAAKTLQLIGMNLSEDAITLGLSATPFMRDDDNLKVEGVLGPIIYKISLRELINEGYLVDALIYYHHLENKIDTRFMNYSDVVTNYIDGNMERNRKITNIAEEADGYILILVNHIEHGQDLKRILKSHNEDVIFLNGQSKDRNKKMNHRIIIATSIFDEGIDIPHLETLILAGGGKSAIRTTQRIGRVLRKFPGKHMATVHDFADDCKYLKNHYLERRAIYEKDFEIIDIK